eukprot:5781051-Pyramimonas_sp.AAC.3
MNKLIDVERRLNASVDEELEQRWQDVPMQDRCVETKRDKRGGVGCDAVAGLGLFPPPMTGK